MDWLVALPVAIPLLVAAALTAFGHFLPLRVDDLIAIAAAATATVCSALLLAGARDDLLVHWFGGWEPRRGVALGLAFAVDPMGAGLALLAGVLVTASLVFSWRYFDEVGTLFHVLMLVFLGAMSGFALSGDLFNLFVFFELMGVAAYALTGYRVEQTGSIQGAFNFAVTNSIGGFMLLLGTTLLYARTGALNLAQIGRAVAESKPDGLLVTAFLLISVGFLVKAAVVPFHFWLADAYAVAPATVCVVFAGVMSDLGIYGLARVYWTVFSGPFAEHEAALRAVLVGFGVMTALVGAVMCFLQRHLKRLLAFAVISHLGVFLAGIALLDPKGLAGAALYVVAHGLLVGGLFVATGSIRRHLRSVDELKLHGRGKELPWLRIVFLAAAAGLAGLPPLGIFLGGSLLEEAAKEAGYAWLPAVLAVASLLVAAALLRVWARVFLGLGPTRDRLLSPEPEEEYADDPAEHRGNVLLVAPAAALVAAGLLVAAVPALSGGTERAAERFQDRSAYAGAVLEDQAFPLPPEPTSHHGSLASIAYGGGSTGGAVLLAALALGRPRQRLAGLGRRAEPVVDALRAAHSGHIGDYVAWLVFGCAVLGGLLALGVGL
jgi:multicomponent Na+:H+ antiporter subunit D